jgi:hypothetical protein
MATTTFTSSLPSWVADLADSSAIDVDWRPTLIRRVSSDWRLNIPERPMLHIKRLHIEYMETFEECQKKLDKVAPEMTILDTEAAGRLQVRARHLAEVVQVYGRMPDVGRETPDSDALRKACLSEWAAVAAGLDESLEMGDSFKAVEDLTPSLNYIRQQHSPADSASSSGQHDQAIGSYDGAALFRTACGLLGLCKGDVRPGDRVWQLAGGRYPFVLHRKLVRPRTSAFSSWSIWPRDKVYSLVGIADIRGLDAEARHVAARWQKDLVETHLHCITLI